MSNHLAMTGEIILSFSSDYTADYTALFVALMKCRDPTTMVKIANFVFHCFKRRDNLS